MKKTATILFSCMALYGYCQTALVKQWDYRYGGSNSESAMSIIQTLDGGYLLGGTTHSGDYSVSQPPRGGSDYWILKVDSEGRKEWDRRYGGTGSDALMHVLQLPDSSYLLGGNSSSPASGDKTAARVGGADYWIVKIDPSGNMVWDRVYGGYATDYFGKIIPAPGKGFIMGGLSNSPAGGDKTQPNWDTLPGMWDSWIVKIDSTGNKEWDRVFGGYNYDSMHPDLYLEGGGYILSGSSSSGIGGDKSQECWGDLDYWMVKIDTAGNKIWDRRYGGGSSDVPLKALAKGKEKFLLAGSSMSGPGGDKTTANIGDEDFWIVCTDTGGNKLWDRTYGGTYTETIRGFEPTSDGGYIVSGVSLSATSGGDKSEDNIGEGQNWIVKVDSNGLKQWEKTIRTNANNGGIMIQSWDGCYVMAGWVNGPKGGEVSQPPFNVGNNEDFWIVKYCEQAVGIDEVTDKAQIQIYPNPFTRDISISLQKQGLGKATFTIVNATGQVIYRNVETNLADSYTKMLDLGNLPNGSYFITVETNGERITRQVVKQ